MEINELVEKAHANAVAHGFYGEDGKNKRNIGELLMLTVSELGEALEADRKHRYSSDKYILLNGKTVDCTGLDSHDFADQVKDTFQDEIADTFIRLADLCGYLGIDIDSYIKAKMAYNTTREKLHGKKY